MLKLKTKTEFPVANGRSIKNVTVRMITSSLSMVDLNNIKVEGYYYYLDENDSVVVLSEFGQNAFKQWEDIEQMENSILQPLESNKNLKSNLLQRLKELTFLQLEFESGQNYGTDADDWELDLD